MKPPFVVARDERPAGFASLPAAAEWFDAWLQDAALPIWGSVGVDSGTGAFREAISWGGEPQDPRRRTRVQARQVFVFASAGGEENTRLARRGFDWFLAQARREDGLFMSALSLDGSPLDPEARLYEHAFVLLALSALDEEDEAYQTLQRLAVLRHSEGGFEERGARPFQANAQMHLLEAALAWRARDGADACWGELVDELADLAATRFIDPATGALHEFFDHLWRPLEGAADLIEPGHMMEWAWLLAQCGRKDTARNLYSVARRGLDVSRGVLVNALHADLGVRDAAARLWPQTEHLKAALILGDRSAALRAAETLAEFLDTPTRGVWRERMDADGRYLEEPSPATSLYHLYLAIRELSRFAAEPC